MESEVAADAMRFDGVRSETVVMLVESEGIHVGDFHDQPDPVSLRWVNERTHRMP